MRAIGRSKLRSGLRLGLGILLAARAVVAVDLEPAPEGLDGRSVAKRAEDTLRSARTYSDGEMTVVSPRLSAPRVVAVFPHRMQLRSSRLPLSSR